MGVLSGDEHQSSLSLLIVCVAKPPRRFLVSDDPVVKSTTPLNAVAATLFWLKLVPLAVGHVATFVYFVKAAVRS